MITYKMVTKHDKKDRNDHHFLDGINWLGPINLWLRLIGVKHQIITLRPWRATHEHSLNLGSMKEDHHDNQRD